MMKRTLLSALPNRVGDAGGYARKTKHLALLNKAVGKRGWRNDLADQLLAPRSTDETGGSVATLSLLCRFSDAGMRRLSTRCGGRRPKSAKARNRGKWGSGGAAGAYGDLAAVHDLSAG